MEKRASLGVLKKRPTKRSKRRGLLSYLRSNSYMFAPLISRSGSHLFPQKTLLFSDTGGRAREENERSLVENIGEYLKSDSYMYAPIVDIEESKHAVAGPICQLERAFVVSSARKTTMDDQSTNQSATLIVENHLSNDDHPEISLTGHSFGQRETVKHMVYQNCRTSTVSEKQRLNKEFRKVVVD
ncbi:hypothetical protein EUGRSUZ_C00213 [Eucalyptus grandis]|uniref:Uncharacterized protein n=3 Tax=Eucalyptus grandis TaxID=71139 RepID=A0A059CK47_EUCGR|nr:hypothetical protein EUGRSUZ_C00213 [Eucalyptus grandis]KAK3435525.1 hypothetical protein EUGRSUZ_C00213 [Eucalyptus grandis]